jgi:hypothetical protein
MELPELREDSSNPSRKAIQETTFGKDVLARYLCSTLQEVKDAIATPSTDFTAIVIGSGMYGAFCAERIYRRGGRVLVLDAGPFVISEQVQNMADPAFDVSEAENLLELPAFGEFRSPAFQDQKRPINYAGHNYSIGGKSVRWGGWSPRLTEEDLALWPADMAQYFRNYYREIEFQIGAFPTADFIKGPLAEAIFARTKSLEGTLDIKQVLPAPIAAQAEQPASGLFSFDKYSSLPVLIEALRGDAKAALGRSLSKNDANSRRAILLVPRCRVLRLETAAAVNGKRRITALRVIHGIAKPADPTQLSDPRPKIDLIPVPSGCAVVLAANSMESTRLALESFLEPQGTASTRMGRNFQVHLRTDITVRIPRSIFNADLRASALRSVEARQRVRSPLEPPDPRTPEEQVDAVLGALQTAALHIQCSTGKRRFHLQLIGVSDPGGEPEALLYRQDTSLPELTGILGSMRSSWIALKFVLVAEIFPDRSLPIGDLNTNWVNLSEFSRDNYSGQGDPQVVSQEYSARKLYSYIRLTKEDEALWLKMDKTALEVARKLAGSGGRIEYWYDGKWSSTSPSDEQLIRLHHSLGSTYHECGTMWMDPDPNQGVVDSFGRFLDFENAYCCDQAVFTTSGSANPVPTGLVVAKRVSEAIMPGREVSEPDFTSLLVFAEPKGDYTALPVELGNMPNGWRFVGSGRFVRRGKMVETVGGIGLLYYAAKKFKDFTLRLEWRCPLPRGNFSFFNNSGIYIRWPREITIANGEKRHPDELTLEEFGTYAIKQGYEIQIDDTGYRPGPEFSGFPEELHNPHHLTGAIYPTFFAGTAPFKLPRFNDNPGEPRRTGKPTSALASRPPGEWNEYEITARSNHFLVKLNGEVVNDATDNDNAYSEGFIGLQNHPNGYRVQFRNVRIKEL